MAGDLNRSIKIYIDNSDAKLKAEELKNKVATLRSELEQLAVTEGKDSDNYKRKEKIYHSATRSLGAYENKVKDTERVLKNLSKATYDELIRAKNDLTKALRKAERGSDDYRNKLLLLRQTNRQLTEATEEMRTSAGRQGDWWSRAADGFNKYIGLIGGAIVALTGLSMKLRQLAQDVAKMDDVYADVMKTTGMTRNEVLDLNEAFKKMDTRTAREELNNLARDAGKLGLSSKKDVLDFVEAGNQINVALGEDLGEGAIKNIGKITEVFKKSTKELDGLDLKGRMLSIGSAINQLGQSSTASEAYLVNFTQRLGGVAAQANISVQDILGYASAMDQSGQAVEMSATALQNFIMKLMGDPAKFAKIAGLEIDKFNKLLKEDTNEAIITVLQALGNKGGFQQLIPMFKEMGLDGARAVGVLSSLATNIHLVKDAQDISNVAFFESVSLSNEYSVKNNNLQAELEKQRKAFTDAALELGERLNPALLKSTNYFTYVVKLAPAVIDFFYRYGKYMLYAATVIALYNAGVKLQIAYKSALHGWRLKELILIKSEIYWTNLSRLAVLAYNAVVALFTGNVTRARAALHLLNLTIKANPIGLLASVIGGVIIGLIQLVKYLKGSNEELNKFKVTNEEIRQATEQYTSSINQEETALKALVTAITNTNEKSDLRKKLIGQLKKEYPQFIGYVDSEKTSNEKLLAILRDVNAEYEKKRNIALLQGKTDAYLGSIGKQQSRQVEIEDEIRKLSENGLTSSEREQVKDLNKEYEALSKGIDFAINKVSELKAEQKTAEEQLSFDNSYAGMSQRMNTLLEELRREQAYLDGYESQVQKGIREETDSFYVKAKQDVADLNNDIDLLTDKMEAFLSKEPEKSKDNPTITDAPLDKDDEKNKKKLRDQQLNEVDVWLTTERNKLKQAYLEKSQYNDQIIASQDVFLSQYEYLEMQSLERRLSIAGLEPGQIEEIQARILDIKIKKLDELEKEEQKRNDDQKKALEKWNEEEEAGALKAAKDFVDRKAQIETISLMEQRLAGLISEEEYQDKLTEIQLQALEERMRIQGLSEEEILDMKQRYLEMQLNNQADFTGRLMGVLDKVKEYSSSVSDAVVAIQEAETSKVGAEYTKRNAALTEQYNQGLISQEEYNAQKEQLDYEQKVKELEIQKKYADVNFAIQAAEIVATTAQGIITAWATSMQLGPVAGPIAATAMTALLAATSVAQLMSAKSERDRVKAMTIEAPGGGSSTPTGARVLNQAAEGRYDVIGADDGKLYRNVPFVGSPRTGIVNTPTIVAEDGGELIVSSPDLKRLQRHVNYPLVISAINDARNGYVPQRAEGNYKNIDKESPAASAQNSELMRVMRENLSLLKGLKSGVLVKSVATVSLTDLKAAQDLDAKSKQTFSK